MTANPRCPKRPAGAIASQGVVASTICTSPSGRVRKQAWKAGVAIIPIVRLPASCRESPDCQVARAYQPPRALRTIDTMPLHRTVETNGRRLPVSSLERLDLLLNRLVPCSVTEPYHSSEGLASRWTSASHRGSQRPSPAPTCGCRRRSRRLLDSIAVALRSSNVTMRTARLRSRSGLSLRRRADDPGCGSMPPRARHARCLRNADDAKLPDRTRESGPTKEGLRRRHYTGTRTKRRVRLSPESRDGSCRELGRPAAGRRAAAVQRQSPKYTPSNPRRRPTTRSIERERRRLAAAALA